MLKSHSCGSKTLFIAPIQEELSATPLPMDDGTFSNMPKATCQKCEAAIPLPLLTEHIKSCRVMDDANVLVTSGSEEENCKN